MDNNQINNNYNNNGFSTAFPNSAGPEPNNNQPTGVQSNPYGEPVQPAQPTQFNPLGNGEPTGVQSNFYGGEPVQPVQPAQPMQFNPLGNGEPTGVQPNTYSEPVQPVQPMQYNPLGNNQPVQPNQYGNQQYGDPNGNQLYGNTPNYSAPKQISPIQPVDLSPSKSSNGLIKVIGIVVVLIIAVVAGVLIFGHTKYRCESLSLNNNGVSMKAYIDFNYQFGKITSVVTVMEVDLTNASDEVKKQYEESDNIEKSVSKESLCKGYAENECTSNYEYKNSVARVSATVKGKALEKLLESENIKPNFSFDELNEASGGKCTKS